MKLKITPVIENKTREALTLLKITYPKLIAKNLATRNRIFNINIVFCLFKIVESEEIGEFKYPINNQGIKILT